MLPEEMTAEEYMLPAPTSEREVAIYQCGYSYGVAEGVRLGREQIVAERLAQQAAHAAAHPFPADGTVKSLRARRLRETPPAERRTAA